MSAKGGKHVRSEKRSARIVRKGREAIVECEKEGKNRALKDGCNRGMHNTSAEPNTSAKNECKNGVRKWRAKCGCTKGVRVTARCLSYVQFPRLSDDKGFSGQLNRCCCCIAEVGTGAWYVPWSEFVSLFFVLVFQLLPALPLRYIPPRKYLSRQVGGFGGLTGRLLGLGGWERWI